MSNTQEPQLVSKKTVDENEQVKVRCEKLANIRKNGIAYPNTFKPTCIASKIVQDYDELDNEKLQAQSIEVSVAGRMMLKRVMGKASFAHLQDRSGSIQLYVVRDVLPEGLYVEFKQWDLGDILGATGTLFRTKTGELTVKVTAIQLLSKSLRPLPDKYHGLADVEQRYRHRYLDLMMNESSRSVFKIRSKVITKIREFLEMRDFMEVETPMMQPLPGGAAAKPFTTHHNTLDMPLFLRIAPELYLKRLVVGGFDRVFEINRNFRNEGVSTQHNPEFTMLEFYIAYATFEDTMDMTEELFAFLSESIFGSKKFTYQGMEIDCSKKFERITICDAIKKADPSITQKQLDDIELAKQVAKQHDIKVDASWGLGKLQTELFEALAEHTLQQPTFLTGFSAEVSPLSRANDDNPFYTDRFELYVAGTEIANSFSELNDPEDQAARFEHQAKARAAGDDEAMIVDHDYIRALEYGLPPTAGEGIGIDRLVMLFTDSASIRDVILFPLMRHQKPVSNIETK